MRKRPSDDVPTDREPGTGYWSILLALFDNTLIIENFSPHVFSARYKSVMLNYCALSAHLVFVYVTIERDLMRTFKTTELSISRASSYELANWAGAVTGTNCDVIQGKFQPGRPDEIPKAKPKR